MRQPMIARLAGHRGFTLLELLVVMVIIGLLAAYVGSIVAMRRMTTPRRRERILRPLS